jgi:hypothetical protein
VSERDKGPSVDIEIRYIQDCPNHGPMTELVQRIADDLGISAVIHEREIRSPAEARRIRFRGSPSLLINGQDIEPDDDYAGPYSLSCRLYGGAGLPSREMVEGAVLAAARRSREGEPVPIPERARADRVKRLLRRTPRSSQ